MKEEIRLRPFFTVKNSGFSLAFRRELYKSKSKGRVRRKKKGESEEERKERNREE